MLIGIPWTAVITSAARPSNSTSSTTRGMVSITLGAGWSLCRSTSRRRSASTARAAASVVGALTARTGRPLSGEMRRTVIFAFGSFETPTTSDRRPEAATNSSNESRLGGASLRTRGNASVITAADVTSASRRPPGPGRSCGSSATDSRCGEGSGQAASTWSGRSAGGATKIVLTNVRTDAGASSTR